MSAEQAVAAFGGAAPLDARRFRDDVDAFMDQDPAPPRDPWPRRGLLRLQRAEATFDPLPFDVAAPTRTDASTFPSSPPAARPADGVPWSC